jgi:hypothetical protein
MFSIAVAAVPAVSAADSEGQWKNPASPWKMDFAQMKMKTKKHYFAGGGRRHSARAAPGL